ncbi:drkB [Symbiodinium sp. CCMP2456]|nr:drkB [Symbiodinium sp. CCMP2456]
MPRALSPPFASPVRPGVASPGSPLPGLIQDHRRLRAVATPLRAEEQSGAWSRESVMQLCSEGDEALFLGRVRLLDRQTVTSIDDAVDSLNRRLVWCPEDGCAVFNAADRAYYLLYRSGRREQALKRMGRLCDDASKDPRSPAMARMVRQDSLQGPPARGSFGASPTGEVLRQNSLAAQGMLQFPHIEERPSARSSKIPGSPPVPPPTAGLAGDTVSARFASPVRRAWQACRRGQSENWRPRQPLAKAPIKVEAPMPVPTKFGFSTPREALERDLTEPEKVRYGELTFVERLGKGEFGEVFRGLYLNKEVAIKQLFFDENMTELVVQDLAREIDSFRHLSHKRLVRFLGACLELPNLCLVTEYMPGGSLHHLLHVRRQKLPASHAMNMCIQIADGVSYLHSQTPTIVHRDLKSLNVVLDLSLNIKAKPQQHSAHAHSHSFPTKEAMTKLRDAPKQVKSTKSTLSEASASEAAAVDKLADLRRCVLQVGDNRMVECDEPSVQQDYNSWKHEVDAQDLKALKEGHAVPVNRTADQHLAKKMKSSLSELTEDPSKLKRAVQLRRMDREEIAAYRNVLSLNLGELEGGRS